MRGTEKPGGGKREAGSAPRRPLELPGFQRLVSALKAVAGMPDYDRYLAHRQARHPGEPVLSRREHYEQYITGRYTRDGGRCC